MDKMQETVKGTRGKINLTEEHFKSSNTGSDSDDNSTARYISDDKNPSDEQYIPKKSAKKAARSSFATKGGQGRLFSATILLIIYDIIISVFSYFAALWLRFDCQYTHIPHDYLNAWLGFTPIYAAVCFLVFFLFKLYHSIWRFASFVELKRTVLACAICGIIHTIGISIFFDIMPMSYYIGGITMQFFFCAAVRFAYRFILLERKRINKKRDPRDLGRVMLIGAGSAGRMLLRDIQNSKAIGEQVCCIIDDNKNKWGRTMDGIPVVGGRDVILLNAEKYHIDKIYFAIPSATAEQKRDLLDICKETNCELKTLPGIYQLIRDKVSANMLRDVSIADLLGRKQVSPDMKEVYDYISGKVVLVTGGGGSIGSELCRQIAAHDPKQLIIFDIYENNAYAIQLELRERYPDLDLVVLIGSVRDSRRVDQVFTKYKPDIVYHAAAHKHVPLMEESPCEAVKNNAIGTYKTAYAAMVNGVSRFVLISTDKAVNPTNIMGASKRLCEMIIQTFDEKIRDGNAADLLPLYSHAADESEETLIHSKVLKSAKTEYVAVRFGNVLGSNGSVVPIFKAQIEKGGPVTVTHPDITRYFMTIPEATSLVLLAGVFANGGEILVLDMGQPVKIDTLARNMIRLSGLRPDIDIKIEYTGLRPGEKLYEEKLMEEEGLKSTPNKLIHIGSPISFDKDAFLRELHSLMEAAYSGKEDELRTLMAKIVTTYKPAEDRNRSL